ncbi:hypothetical protein Dimus_024862 [Dionaea muscipula]
MENGKDDEIIDLAVGRESEHVIDGATRIERAPQGGEIELLDISLLGDNATLREYLTTLNKIEMSDEEATDVVAKETKVVASPPQKERKATKGGVATSRSKEVGEGKGKDVTVSTMVVPLAESRDKPGAGKESKKIKGKGKAGMENRDGALERVQEAEKKEQVARAESKLNADKRSSMENKHVKAFKEAIEYKSKVETVAGALTENDFKLAELLDDIKKLKVDNSMLE